MGMRSGNEHIIPFLIHYHELDNLSDDRKEIKNNSEGNEISLISGILIHRK